MKKFFSIIALIFSASLFLSQEVKIKVLGQISYEQLADKKIYIITFNNNYLSTSDYSPQTHKDNFFKNLDTENISYKISEKFGMNNIPNIRENYIIEIPIIHEKKIDEIIRKHSVHIMRNYFQFDNNFEQQDEMAVLATNNAIEKAKSISKILDLKTLNIISIDDDSNQVLLSSLLDSSGIPEDRKEQFLELLTRLNELENTNSSQIYRTGGYSIWVTFSLN